MKIIFMGNPQFAVPCLTTLVENGITPVAVVSDPPKRIGRGQQFQEQPMAETAHNLNLPIIQPDSISDPEFCNTLSEFEPDLFIVVAFKVLPKALLSIPKIGSINLHGSLLPAYRGAAPIQQALINGEKETGLTTFFLKSKVDTGDILIQEKISIHREDDFGSLSERMSHAGAELLLQTINAAIKGTLKPIPQNDSLASPAPKIHPDLGRIDWRDSAETIRNLIRGLSPRPGAFSFWNGKKVKFFGASFNQNISQSPGKFIELKKDVIEIAAGSGHLEIREIQLEGKKRMQVADFIRGSAIKPGDEFKS